MQFAFFIAYGLISIPAGSLLRRIGYKKGVIVGLAVMGVGCLLFYPASSFRSFPLFMFGYFILASGMTILQVAANPYVAVLGDEKSASSRLNLSQAFNSLGTAIAPLLGAAFILSDHIKSSEEIAVLTEGAREDYLSKEAETVQGPFIVLALSLFALALLVLLTKLPKILNRSSGTGYGQVLKHSNLALGALAIFVYVGAEVGIGSYLVNYFLDMNMAETIRDSNWLSRVATMVHQGSLANLSDKGLVASMVVFYWSGAMLGRFVGSYLTRVFSPKLVLAGFTIGAIVMVLISMSTMGTVSMISILSVGLFNSIMFPTIFGLAIEGLDDLKPQASGILCTAIAGGAFIPPLFGYFTDMAGFKTAFVLIICCYLYIFFYTQKVKSIA